MGGTPAEGAPTNFGVNHKDLKEYLKDAQKHPKPDHPEWVDEMKNLDLKEPEKPKRDLLER